MRNMAESVDDAQGQPIFQPGYAATIHHATKNPWEAIARSHRL